ncbi:MAG TPA: AmmeMemoRadiSam system protein B [Bacillota bacterium]
METRQKESDRHSLRQPMHAGSFYPGDPQELRRTLDELLGAVCAEARETPRAVIVPHAGYQFSGPAAACSYKVLRDGAEAIKRVILLAPSHYSYVRGVVLVEADYQTPLGVYPVDGPAIQTLKETGFPWETNRVAATGEHSDEVQIPFLQTVLPQAKLVPMIVGDLDETERAEAARTIVKVSDEQTVIVTSSDFTHYGKRFGFAPALGGDTRAGIYRLDQGAIERLPEGADSFRDYIKSTGATICGYNPITLLLEIFAAQDWPIRPQLLQYYTSGDLTDDWENSVSYAAVALGALVS